MIDLKSEFEKIPEIKKILMDGEVFFDDKEGLYYGIRQDDGGVGESLNLSFLVFKSQKEKTCSILSSIDWHIEDCNISEQTEYNKAWLEAMIFVKREILK